MDAQGAPLPFSEDIEIPSRLGCFHRAEGEFAAGDGKVKSVVTGDLQEHAGVRAAFIGLTGSVQKARPEAEAGGNAFLVAHVETHFLQVFLMLEIVLDVGEQGEIIASPQPVQM